jgi:hypothetical protein
VSRKQRLQVFFMEDRVGQGKIESWAACEHDAGRRDAMYSRRGAWRKGLPEEELRRLEMLSGVPRDDSKGSGKEVRVHILYAYCTHIYTVRMLYHTAHSCCTHAVPCCTRIVRMLYHTAHSCCTHAVLILYHTAYSCCTHAVPYCIFMLYSYCTHTVPYCIFILCPYCTILHIHAVLTLYHTAYSCCTHTVPYCICMLYSCCVCRGACCLACDRDRRGGMRRSGCSCYRCQRRTEGSWKHTRGWGTARRRRCVCVACTVRYM